MENTQGILTPSLPRSVLLTLFFSLTQSLFHLHSSLHTPTSDSFFHIPLTSPCVYAVLLSDGVKLEETENSGALFMAWSFFLKFFFKVIPLAHCSIVGGCHLFHPFLCSDTRCVVLSLPSGVIIFHYKHPCPCACVHSTVDAKASDTVTIVKHTSMVLWALNKRLCYLSSVCGSPVQWELFTHLFSSNLVSHNRANFCT